MDSMFDWLRRRGVRVNARPAAAVDSAREGHAIADEYEFLYKYLRDRYANRVVLTFAEIEDLLGFSLPVDARVQQMWWSGTAPVGRRSTQSDAWTLAGRTATVNLLAQSVVFDRDTG
jgi:hypothetical protein